MRPLRIPPRRSKISGQTPLQTWLADKVRHLSHQHPHSATRLSSQTIHIANMPPKRVSYNSRRSLNPITGAYNALFVSENAPIVRSVVAFGVSFSHAIRLCCSVPLSADNNRSLL